LVCDYTIAHRELLIDAEGLYAIPNTGIEQNRNGVFIQQRLTKPYLRRSSGDARVTGHLSTPNVWITE
jgi:hypothetical protein